MTIATVLLAAADDWLRLIVPIVFIIIYAVNHLLSAGKGKTPPAGKTQPRRPPAGSERPLRPRPQPPGPQAAPQPGQQMTPQAQLNAEIEKFLKSASQRRGNRPGREPTIVGKAPPKPSPREQPTDVKPIERRDFDSVATSVEKHLADRGFKQRAEHLADDIVRADQQMEDHLQKVFSRKVGTLTTAPTKTEAGPVTDAKPEPVTDRPSTSADLAAMLANPQTIKQAVILNEILQRPEARW